MKLLTTLFSLVLSSSAFASAQNESPHELFNATKNRYTQIQLSWHLADNVQDACDKESHRRGFGGFKNSLEACAFWDKNVCMIITEKRTNMHILGHEILHCFQGSFH